jgi:tetratricopeptide (TPR) repeat protein
MIRYWFCVLALLAVAATELKKQGTGTPLHRPPPVALTNTPARVDVAPAPDPELDRLLREAQRALDSNDPAAAADGYELVLARAPRHALAAVNLGVIRYQQGRLEAAAQVLRLAPADGRARALVGIILFRQGKLEDALTELESAVALTPDNAEAHNFLGVVLSEKGRAIDGERAVRRALELKPGYADAHMNVALLYVRQAPPRVELARLHYRKAIHFGATPDAALERLLQP